MCLEWVRVMVTALHVLYVLVCGTIISWFCEYFVINLWNECFIIKDGLSEMINFKESDNSEWIWWKGHENMGQALIGLVIQLCLLVVIMTFIVIYDVDLNYFLD